MDCAKKWAEQLDLMLDKAYQNQQDMMVIWQASDEVCQTLKKQLDEERDE